MEQDSPQVTKKAKKKSPSSSWLMVMGIVLILVAAVLLVWFFLHGETKVSGGWPEPEVSVAVVCKSESFEYPFFTYDQSSSKTTEINAVFKDDKLSMLSFIYTLGYGNEAASTESEARNHAAMNISFGNAGLEADALGASYSVLSDAMKFSLSADGNAARGIGARYFMLTGGETYNVGRLMANYQGQGFECEQK